MSEMWKKSELEADGHIMPKPSKEQWIFVLSFLSYIEWDPNPRNGDIYF